MIESRLSALVDGELEQEDAMLLLASVKERQELQDEWMLLHLIGDTLRQTPSLSSDFNTRFSAQLAKEPTVLAPRAIRHEQPPAENRRLPGRWALPHRPLIKLSAAASVAAVSLVAWTAFQFNDGHESGSRANVVVAENSTSGARPAANVSSYLAAHQEYSHVMQDSGSYQRAVFATPQGGGR